MSDQYRAIPGFGGFCISEFGEVMNDRGMLLRSFVTGIGYERISLMGDDGVRRGVDVHRLVAAAWVLGGEIPRGLWVNHLDGDKLNNAEGNLEVVTPSESHRHAREVLGRRSARGEAAGKAKLSEDQVREIRRRGALGESCSKLGKEFGVSRVSVHFVLSRKTWGHVE